MNTDLVGLRKGQNVSIYDKTGGENVPSKLWGNQLRIYLINPAYGLHCVSAKIDMCQNGPLGTKCLDKLKKALKFWCTKLGKTALNGDHE